MYVALRKESLYFGTGTHTSKVVDWLDPGSLGHRQLSLPFSRPRRWRQWMPWTASHELSLRQWPKFVGVDVGALGGMSILLAGRSFSFLSFSYCRRGERFFSRQDTTYFGRATARRRTWLVDCMPSKGGTASSLSPARRLGYLMFHSMTEIHMQLLAFATTTSFYSFGGCGDMGRVTADHALRLLDRNSLWLVVW